MVKQIKNLFLIILILLSCKSKKVVYDYYTIKPVQVYVYDENNKKPIENVGIKAFGFPHFITKKDGFYSTKKRVIELHPNYFFYRRKTVSSIYVYHIDHDKYICKTLYVDRLDERFKLKEYAQDKYTIKNDTIKIKVYLRKK